MSLDKKALNVLMMPDYRQDNPYQNLLSEALEKDGLKVTFCEGYYRIFPIWRQINKQKKICDVLHLHWLNPYLKGENWFVKFVYCIKFLIDICLVKLLGVKIVWTIHNLAAHNTKFPRLEKVVKQCFLWLNDQTIVHSEAAKVLVLQAYFVSEAKVTVIPHGHYRDVYPAAIAPELAREKLGLPPTGLIFLNFGLLKPYKGVDKLIEIWRSHSEDLQDTQLLIVGKALDEDYGETLMQLSASVGGIELRDEFVPETEIHLYFSAADVVVLPFQQILTSGSLLLAMSYGKPIIAPRFASLEETIGNASDLLYDADQEDALWQIIQRATAQSDLMDLSQRTKIVCDALNWSAIAKRTRDLYQS
ncbi:glycosyltransferase [[Limnothrix rosea] IAM M-220]|uniref:glycosyltransferase n=1 Tax=[Limnothrix rosea] IAM M-220 TaxID=454133 RepID=UPI00095E2299|nr:glycosyltransferase [[Limnothrix rosea] IAM M-220]OKH11498.1 hypothetical protein NIES208_17220 [[Limnothrix rosea] IAM M-220]